jgi:ADP-dependent NAD(P)H-hydrate dehydratase / NAD(P)H-hydrate epimerase
MDPAAHRRFGALTPSEIAALDTAATSLGVDVVQLMEVAGFQVARLAWHMIGSRANRVHVVAGHGNNGGDGLVAARYLAAWGCTVSVAVLREPDRLPRVIELQSRAARGAGVAVSASPDPSRALGDDDVALTVDALLGTGISQAPRPAHAEVIERMRGPTLSVDVPSGLDAADGLARGVAVHATATCTLTACKRGFWVAAAAVHTGAVYVADIGMPMTAWAACGLTPPSAVRGGALRRVPIT